MRKTVLGIFAHPDDAEIICAGTLSLLGKAGWEVHIASLAPGDKGTAEYNRQEISTIRKEEARMAADLIGATYHCLEFEDLYILYDRESINKTTALIRKIQPSLVFTSPPSDYMVDHEMVSKIVQTACFATGVKNMEVQEAPYGPVPYLYYCDPIEGKDKFGIRTQPTIYIDITSEIEIKKKMLSCHKSQRNWLKIHHKMDEYIVSMERFAMMRGSEINTDYAEGFVQHLGHGFPQNNILKEVISEDLIKLGI
jgi:LmbE family N-acetylglucosaminyl deacetylase